MVSTARQPQRRLGFEGVVDTVRTMEQLGIRSIGSGRNIDVARKPAIFEKQGVKVASSRASVILRSTGRQKTSPELRRW